MAAGLGFVFGFFGSIPIAGPIAVLVLGAGLERRFGRGLGLSIGAGVAEGIYALLALWGFGSLLERLPWSYPVAYLASAIILLGLGGLLLTRAGAEASAQAAPERAEVQGRGGDGVAAGLAIGFTITAVNPTLIATWSMAVTVLYAADLVQASEGTVLAFGAGAAAGIIGWFATLLAVLYRYRERISTRVVRASRRWAAVLVLGFGLYFAARALLSWTSTS